MVCSMLSDDFFLVFCSTAVVWCWNIAAFCAAQWQMAMSRVRYQTIWKTTMITDAINKCTVHRRSKLWTRPTIRVRDCQRFIICHPPLPWLIVHFYFYFFFYFGNGKFHLFPAVQLAVVQFTFAINNSSRSYILSLSLFLCCRSI